MKLELVEDAKHAWKWFSVQCMAASGAILITWSLLPDDLKATLPQNSGTIAAGSALALGIIGRLTKQNVPGGQ